MSETSLAPNELVYEKLALEVLARGWLRNIPYVLGSSPNPSRTASVATVNTPPGVESQLNCEEYGRLKLMMFSPADVGWTVTVGRNRDGSPSAPRTQIPVATKKREIRPRTFDLLLNNRHGFIEKWGERT